MQTPELVTHTLSPAPGAPHCLFAGVGAILPPGRVQLREVPEAHRRGNERRVRQDFRLRPDPDDEQQREELQRRREAVFDPAQRGKPARKPYVKRSSAFPVDHPGQVEECAQSEEGGGGRADVNF